MNKFKQITALLCSCTIMGGMVAGCSQPKAEAVPTTAPTQATTQPTDAKTGGPVTLTLLQWDNLLTRSGYDVVAEYKKVNPNVTLEIENVKDTGEFEQAMKIRKAANELPDVFLLKPYMLADFGAFAADLGDLEATKDNIYAEQFKVNDKVVALPTQSFNEFVWYSKAIFKEYNLEIPKTWDEFIKTAETIKAGGKYIPILMGAKDTWPVYPFNEFMPALVSNNGAYWNKMAEEDQPFSKDTDFYKSYQMIQKLYDAKVFGEDPLGIGVDQAKTMLGSKGAMICLGQWYLGDAKKVMEANPDDLGSFLLPVRTDATQPLNAVTMVDTFLATPDGGEKQAAAKEFINWFLTNPENYKAFAQANNIVSTMKSVDAGLDPVLAEAFKDVNVNAVIYDGGNKKFQELQAATKFDYKQMGQEMIAGKDLDGLMTKFNEAWKKAYSAIK